jgi:hypothetical protein
MQLHFVRRKFNRNFAVLTILCNMRFQLYDEKAKEINSLRCNYTQLHSRNIWEGMECTTQEHGGGAVVAAKVSLHSPTFKHNRCESR